MRKLTIAALITALVLPAWKIHSLNAAVDFLRENHQSVPFFAFYRYGFQTDSVVFNVNAQSCDTVVDHVIPAFEEFVSFMRTVNPSEVRLAWQGETVAIVERPAMESIWQDNSWNAAFSLDPLSRAVVCTEGGTLLIDWSLLSADPSVMT